MARFFRPSQRNEIEVFFTRSFVYKYSPAHPYSDFRHFSDLGMAAYVLDERNAAFEFMSKAVQLGFSPDFPQGGPHEFRRQWKNYLDGTAAVKVGLAAHIIEQPQRRDEILAWALERLLDTELIMEDQDSKAARVALYRSYAALAMGRPWAQLESDLDLAVRMVKKGTFSTAERPLAHTLISLVKAQNGTIPREKASTQLTRLIRDANGSWLDRLEACFYALHLQSVFPDVFDEVLPPFPTGVTPTPDAVPRRATGLAANMAEVIRRAFRAFRGTPRER